MVPKIFTLCFCLLIATALQAQWSWANYFEGDSPAQFALTVFTDTTDTQHVWQIGPPQKTIFHSAATVPNAMVTDTINPYPPNDTSRFYVEFNQNYLDPWGILAIRWSQKLDLEAGDLAMVEYKQGDSIWVNTHDNPYVYNYYGFDVTNIDTLSTGEIGFSGTDTIWRDIWYCMDLSFLSNMDSTLQLRYTIVSDSNDNPHEGWAIDNMQAHMTFIHTVAEHEQSEYMNVYPTATDGRVHIETRKTDQYHIIEHMELFTLDGKLVKRYGKAPTKFFIDLDEFSNGAYVLNVTTNLLSESFRLMLNR